MQNAVVNIANGAICCKLWPKTISGMDRTRTMEWGMDRTRTMGVVVQGPPAVFPGKNKCCPGTKICFGVGKLVFGPQKHGRRCAGASGGFSPRKTSVPLGQKCSLGWENMFSGIKTMGVVVQGPPAVFPREKQVFPWDKGVFWGGKTCFWASKPWASLCRGLRRFFLRA